MIGPIEKGIEAAKIASPKQGMYHDVDLTVLPKYICFRAALVREKLTLQYVILILVVGFAVQIGIAWHEISSLTMKLREKEYILAPGVQDFMPASPHSVSDRYIEHAVSDFISKVATVSPANIGPQYQQLAESMSHELKVKFEGEAAPWVVKVKRDKLTEIFTVLFVPRGNVGGAVTVILYPATLRISKVSIVYFFFILPFGSSYVIVELIV